jgi:hypothetical protein
VNDVHLSFVVRIGRRSLLSAPGVDILPDPHPPEAIPPLHPDAAIRRLMNEVAHRADDLPFLMIHAHGVIVTARGGMQPARDRIDCPSDEIHATPHRIYSIADRMRCPQDEIHSIAA